MIFQLHESDIFENGLFGCEISLTYPSVGNDPNPGTDVIRGEKFTIKENSIFHRDIKSVTYIALDTNSKSGLPFFQIKIFKRAEDFNAAWKSVTEKTDRFIANYGSLPVIIKKTTFL